MKELTYKEARKVFNYHNERGLGIPKDVMNVIVEHENSKKKHKSPGIRKKELDSMDKDKLNHVLSKGFKIYKYLDTPGYINYEGLKKGDLLAAEFNGVNFVTENILECAEDKDATINAHPSENFNKRYKLVKC